MTSRRTFLRAVGAGSLGFATGCLGGPGGTAGGPERPGDGTGGTPTETPRLHGDDTAYRGGFDPGSAWRMDCGDPGRSGRNPDAAVPRGDVGASWLRTAAGRERSFFTTAPATDDRAVYVGSGAGRDDDGEGHHPFVTSFDGADGTRRWRTRAIEANAGRVAGLAVADGQVVAVVQVHGGPGTALVGFDAGDGTRAWKREVPHAGGGPAVRDGTAYVTARPKVHACGLDGSPRWSSGVPDPEGDEYLDTQPCVGDGAVFVGTDRGNVVAYDAADGSVAWKERVVDAGHRPRIQSTPTVAEGVVYVSGTDYRTYAVDAADGTVRWEHRLLEEDNGNTIPSVAVRDDVLYVNTIHGGVVALDRGSGSERWRTGKYGGSRPAAVGDSTFLAPVVGGGVGAYDLEGDRQWAFEMEAFDVGFAGYVMDPEVVPAHGQAYVTLNDGRVYALGSEG